MTSQHRASISRRELLKTVGVGSLALAGFAPLIHTLACQRPAEDAEDPAVEPLRPEV